MELVLVCTNMKFCMFIIVEYHYNHLETTHTSQLSIMWTLTKWWWRTSNGVSNKQDWPYTYPWSLKGREHGSIERLEHGSMVKMPICHVVSVEILPIINTQLGRYKAINVWIIPRRHWFPTLCLCQHKPCTPNSHPSLSNSL